MPAPDPLAADPPDGIDAGFVPVRAPWVHTVELDGEAVLLDESEDRLHLLNHSATLVWLCFDGRASIAELAAELSSGLGADRDQVLADTLAVTRELAAEGLLGGGSR